MPDAPKLPKVYAAVVGINDPEDSESIAYAAAQAALELLIKVTADARGSTVLDRVCVVQPTPLSGANTDTLLDDFFGGLRLGQTPQRSKYAVMVSCRVQEPKPKVEKTDDSQLS